MIRAQRVMIIESTYPVPLSITTAAMVDDEGLLYFFFSFTNKDRLASVHLPRFGVRGRRAASKGGTSDKKTGRNRNNKSGILIGRNYDFGGTRYKNVDLWFLSYQILF